MKTIKSGKQRKLEIRVTRAKRRARQMAAQSGIRFTSPAIRVEEHLLAPNNSYGVPDFVFRGYYLDLPFRCKDCGAEGLWTAQRQKWWYEVAKGDVNTKAIRCKTCRAKERTRKQNARRIQQQGILEKQARAAA